MISDVAFVEHPEAYDAYQNWGVVAGTGLNLNVSATVNGITEAYSVDLVASSGKQRTNQISNCFNGGTDAFYETDKGGSDGFYGVINREPGLSTTEMNNAIIPAYSKKKEGLLTEKMGSPVYEDLVRW